MSIEFPFDGYPRDAKTVISGTVTVSLTQRPALPISLEREAAMVNAPMQAPLKWKIDGYDLPKLKGKGAPDLEDLNRFIRGKFWHRIETLLYADYLRNVNLDAEIREKLAVWADVYEQLGRG